MIHAKSGYTLIEVLVVVAILGILSAIAVVSWSALTVSSRNNLRAQDIKQWSSTFDAYKGRYYAYPVMPDAVANITSTTGATYCLGDFTGSPYNGKCGAFTSSNAAEGVSASLSSSLLSEVTKIGKPPENTPDIVVGKKLAGPILYTYQTSSGTAVTVYARIINFFENISTCPSGLSAEPAGTASPANAMMTQANIPNDIACSLSKQFIYDPTS